VALALEEDTRKGGLGTDQKLESLRLELARAVEAVGQLPHALTIPG